MQVVVNLVQFPGHYVMIIKEVLVNLKGNQVMEQGVQRFQVTLEYTRVNF